MRVIIKDKFYEFQNAKTESIFNGQKDYLASVVSEFQGEDKLEELLTNLFCLYNLTEGLIDQIVTMEGVEKTIQALNAKSI